MFILRGLYFLLVLLSQDWRHPLADIFHRSINSNIWLCSYLYCLTYSFQAIKSISIADVNQTEHIDNLCTIFFSRCSICYSFPKANAFIVIIFLLLAQIFYFYIIIQLPKLLKEPFSPVFSAFTFPLVISATALKNSLPVLMFPDIWKGLLFIEVLLATVIVLRVFIGYLHFFLKRKNKINFFVMRLSNTITKN